MTRLSDQLTRMGLTTRQAEQLSAKYLAAPTSFINGAAQAYDCAGALDEPQTDDESEERSP